MHKETKDELTRAVLAAVIFVAQKFQQERAFLLPHAVSVFPDNYPQAKDNKGLYLELGDGAVKFLAQCMASEPTNHLSSAIRELHSCISMLFFWQTMFIS